MPPELVAAFKWLGVPTGVVVVAGLVFLVLWKTPLGRKLWERLAAWASVRVRWKYWTLKQYRDEVLKRDRHVPLPFRREEHEPIELIDIYVEQDAGTDRQPIKRRIDLGEPGPLRYVVTGDPGAGKTLLLQSLLYRWAEGFDPTSQVRVPVRVVLESLALRAKRPETALRDAIIAFFETRGITAPQRFVDHALDHGKLSILLDALDEVPRQSRHAINDMVKHAVEKYPSCHFLVTCRASVYKGAFQEFAELEICGFDDGQVDAFLDNWAARPGGDAHKVLTLKTALAANPRLRELSRSPLLLTYMAYLYGRSGSVETLPYSRTEFYDKVVEYLVDDQKDGHRFSGDIKLMVLKRLAVETLDSEHGRVMSYEYQIDTIMDVVVGFTHEDAETLLKAITERSGLVHRVEAGGYAFAHLTIQEYFVALSLRDNADAMLANVRQNLGLWREVAKLWFGVTRSNARSLWLELYKVDNALAYECLVEVRGTNPMFEVGCLTEVDSKLVAAIREPDRTSMYARELELLAAHPVVGPIVTNQAAIELHETTERGEPDGRYVDAMATILRAVPFETMILRLTELSRTDPTAREALDGLEATFIVNTIEARAESGHIDEALKLLDINVEAASAPRFVAFFTRLMFRWDAVWTLPEAGSVTETLQARMAWHLVARMMRTEDEEALNRSWSLSAHQRMDDWKPFETKGTTSVTYFMGMVMELAKRRMDQLPHAVKRIDPRVAMLIVASRVGEQTEAQDVMRMLGRESSQSITDWLKERMLVSASVPNDLVEVLMNSVSTETLSAFARVAQRRPESMMRLFWSDLDETVEAQPPCDEPRTLRSLVLKELDDLRESGVSPYSHHHR
ncbi:MAG TPA: NACHT domain-containing protein [Stackebrandtia sp.]|uniref:NACHT domain-containing protein n=1 Tax=Stackebrandtia sp. TaxID=2023065 RepID=UPI002D6D1E97|nr:NACHT domain-containing protein [Stackebrandtia sp.]HZE38300.1 NACHT domain-containing protein [Stackebrandtia sp.]